ncbi:MAG: glycoside hydrolase family 88 protein, partial [Ignavibacteriae bacterium]|nr:glycoside hydrolase family 88 protein [Ignavibacteriota bacterium]
MIAVEFDQPWSKRIAQSFVLRHPGSVTYDEYMTKNSWNYEQGVMLEAMKKMYEYTNDEQYFNFIKENIDQFVDEKGNIKEYPYDAFNSDHINAGKALLFLYEKTKESKYKTAADILRKQIQNQPRTISGGFWHKKIYPYQMWLDGLYMAEPFYAQYSKIFSQPENYDDIIHQFKLVYEKTVDEKTGLLYHAWNENKEQKWADKETGRSPHFWGRAIGWYVMAIVDVLDFIPEQKQERQELINILQNVSEALINFRDCNTGLWY